jgi:pimeloyl-ACP methyl ester carboxylesterase
MPSASRTIVSEVPTALLLPGLLCDPAVWAGQIAVLHDRLHCLVPDYAELDSLPQMAQAALELAPARFVLVGHSMGGRVALEIMRTAAARVSALALLDTGYQARAPGPPGEEEARARHALVQLAQTHGMRAMGRVWVQDMVPPQRLGDAALIESILAMVERRTPQVLAAQIRALLARPEAADVLPQIRCPTLLLCGRQDHWSPLRRHEAMQHLIGSARLEVIEDCGHMAPMEQPAEVAARLQRWLQAAGALR